LVRFCYIFDLVLITFLSIHPRIQLFIQSALTLIRAPVCIYRQTIFGTVL
ncbi:hypothetical protein T07_13869, partial [Trichinella nelsoni]